MAFLKEPFLLVYKTGPSMIIVIQYTHQNSPHTDGCSVVQPLLEFIRSLALFPEVLFCLELQL